MNCMEARRMVTPFVKKELSEKETEQFLKHIEHCSDCMDELDIYFTMYKALDTLDSGSRQEYDFKKMLTEEIRSAKRAIIRARAMRVLSGAVLVLAEFLLLVSVYTGIEMRKVELEHTTFQRAISRLSTHGHPAGSPDAGMAEAETAAEMIE